MKIAELNSKFEVVSTLENIENAEEEIQNLRNNAKNGQRFVLLDETDEEMLTEAETDAEKKQILEELIDEQLDAEEDATGGLSLNELGLSLEDADSLDALKRLQEALKAKQKAIQAALREQKKLMAEKMREAKKEWFDQIVQRTLATGNGEYSGMYGVFQTQEERTKKDLTGYVMLVHGVGNFDDEAADKTYTFTPSINGGVLTEKIMVLRTVCHASALKQSKEHFCSLLSA